MAALGAYFSVTSGEFRADKIPFGNLEADARRSDESAGRAAPINITGAVI